MLLRSHFDAQHFAHYTLHGLEAATGQPLWSNDVAYSTPGIGTMTNLHNRTLTQPTLVGTTVLLATTSYQGGRRGLQAFDLKTGRRDERLRELRPAEGLRRLGSATALFHRGYQCAAYDLNRRPISTSARRPGPAAGSA